MNIQMYGPREAYIDIDLMLKAVRRRLLKANDEHGNKVLRKAILDEFGEIERFTLGRLLRAGVIDAGAISPEAQEQNRRSDWQVIQTRFSAGFSTGSQPVSDRGILRVGIGS